MAKKGSNFQWLSSGRKKTDKALTFKVRQNKKTKSVNVRCSKGVPTEACQVAERLAAKAMTDIAAAQETDETRKRAAMKAMERAKLKAKRAAMPKAPF
jgi:capsular polysaccharide biosynthesis protein